MSPFRRAAEIPEEVRTLSPEMFDRWCKMREKLAESETERLRARGDSPYVLAAVLAGVAIVTAGCVVGVVHGNVEETKGFV